MEFYPIHDVLLRAACLRRRSLRNIIEEIKKCFDEKNYVCVIGFSDPELLNNEEIRKYVIQTLKNIDSSEIAKYIFEMMKSNKLLYSDYLESAIVDLLLTIANEDPSYVVINLVYNNLNLDNQEYRDLLDFAIENYWSIEKNSGKTEKDFVYNLGFLFNLKGGDIFKEALKKHISSDIVDDIASSLKGGKDMEPKNQSWNFDRYRDPAIFELIHIAEKYEYETDLDFVETKAKSDAKLIINNDNKFQNLLQIYKTPQYDEIIGKYAIDNLNMAKQSQLSSIYAKYTDPANQEFDNIYLETFKQELTDTVKKEWLKQHNTDIFKKKPEIVEKQTLESDKQLITSGWGFLKKAIEFKEHGVDISSLPKRFKNFVTYELQNADAEDLYALSKNRHEFKNKLIKEFEIANDLRVVIQDKDKLSELYKEFEDIFDNVYADLIGKRLPYMTVETPEDIAELPGTSEDFERLKHKIQERLKAAPTEEERRQLETQLRSISKLLNF